MLSRPLQNLQKCTDHGQRGQFAYGCGGRARPTKQLEAFEGPKPVQRQRPVVSERSSGLLR